VKRQVCLNFYVSSVLLVAFACTRRAPASGLLVVEATPGYAAAQADLRPGDVLSGWSGGQLATPFDLDAVEREQSGRAAVELHGTRAGAPLTVRIPAGTWKLRTRPVQSAGTRTDAAWGQLEAARAAAAANDWKAVDTAAEAARAAARAQTSANVIASVEEAIGLLREQHSEPDRAAEAYRAAMKTEAHEAPKSLRQAWRITRLGAVVIGQEKLDEAKHLYQQALEMSQAVAPASLEEAAAWNGLGGVRMYSGDYAGAIEPFSRALALREQVAPGGVDVATSLNNLSELKRILGDFDDSEQLQRRAIAIRERLVPNTTDMSQSLCSLGSLEAVRGDLSAGDQLYRRALEIERRRAPGRLREAEILNDLGALTSKRGRLTEAEGYYERAMTIYETLAPQSRQVALVLNNLGTDAMARGSLAVAEERLRRALALWERLEPRGADVGFVLANLAEVASERGDAAAAEEYSRRSLAQAEAATPGALAVASALTSLTNLRMARGETNGARAALQKALGIARAKAPRGIETTLALQSLADLAVREKAWATAERQYREGALILRDFAPGSEEEAEALQKLASFYQSRRRPDEALDAYRRALAALEIQRGAIGGGDEARATFTRHYESLYGDAIDFLMSEGRPEEAFQVLERYRARGFLSLLAERDLSFTADVPEALDRERRVADVEYDRAQSELLRADGTQVADAQRTLSQARVRQTEIRDRIRAASPRLAVLQHPEPLDLAAARAALDPGTALVSYEIGTTASYVFVVGPGPTDLHAVRLPTNRALLGTEVGRFRDSLRRDGDTEALREQARHLGDLLLAPATAAMNRAERLVIVPDGPLHLLPFAALIPPGWPRYLVESKPLHVVASATVFAELKKRRRPSRPVRLVAFGDPDYSAVPRRGSSFAEDVGARFALLRGVDLDALPSARREVETLRQLFPAGAQTFLGRDATEERAKSIGTDASIIHFACHAVANEASPLDSSLALSIPAAAGAGRDNGLLQASEILEQVRIDADLVTLSACNTALGPDLSGEGLLGLSRAFQYAGARTLLASLWDVNDAPTSELMTRFYRHLKEGQTKDAALRSAQLELLQAPASSHPSHWAAFQVMGDWR
jgi:CHAT domain-containing protein/Tfp pilus assembly protein PilF